MGSREASKQPSDEKNQKGLPRRLKNDDSDEHSYEAIPEAVWPESYKEKGHPSHCSKVNHETTTANRQKKEAKTKGSRNPGNSWVRRQDGVQARKG